MIMFLVCAYAVLMIALALSALILVVSMLIDDIRSWRR